MAESITYLYESNDGDSFTKLSEYAIKSGAIVTINPDKRTILATTDQNDGSVDDPINFLDSVIDNDGLSVRKTLDDVKSDILKQIADLTKENETLADARKKSDEDRQFYRERYYKVSGDMDRIKNRIGAIATLIEAIVQ